MRPVEAPSTQGPKKALTTALGVFALGALITLAVQGPSIRPAGECQVDTWHITRSIPWVATVFAALLTYRVVLRVLARWRAAAIVVGDGPYRQSAIAPLTPLVRPKKHEAALALLVLLSGGAGALQSRSWSCVAGVPRSCNPPSERAGPTAGDARRKVVVMEVGDAEQPSIAGAMVAHLRDCLGLPAVYGGRYRPAPTMRDVARDQWIGERILERLAGACRARSPECAGALVIGVTPLDIYTTREAWRFALAVRNGDVALVSTAHMSGLLDGTKLSRARKMVTKTVALQYCGLAPSPDPRSIRYGKVRSIGDLDALDETDW